MGYRITRIELDTHRCKTFLRKMSVHRACLVKLKKRFDYIKSNQYGKNIVKSGAKIQVYIKKNVKI